MPLKLNHHAMVTSPSGKGVIVMGGHSPQPQGSSKAMFELYASMEWTRLEQTMKISYPLAIPIPDELVFEIEKINGIELFSM